MTATEQGPTADGLVARVKDILFTPAEAWSRIEAEPATIKGLYVGYACILAAIGPIARLIGSQLFGYHFLYLNYRPSIIQSVSQAVVSYILSLVAVYVLAFIIEALAPTFGGTKDRVQAFKVAVYSSTAAWIAGIFALLPPASALGIIGIYSLYLLYVGLPKLMKAPSDKGMGYTIAVVVADIVIFVVVAAVTSAVVGVGSGFAGMART
jgi:hypothetical protein